MKDSIHLVTRFLAILKFSSHTIMLFLRSLLVVIVNVMVMLITVWLRLMVVMSVIVNITQWETIVRCVSLYIIINRGILPPKLMLINVKSASAMVTLIRASTMRNLDMDVVKTVKTTQLDQNATNVLRTFIATKMAIALHVIATWTAPKHHNAITTVNVRADLVLKAKNVTDVKTISLVYHELVASLVTVTWLVVKETSPSAIQSLVNANVK